MPKRRYTPGDAFIAKEGFPWAGRIHGDPTAWMPKEQCEQFEKAEQVVQLRGQVCAFFVVGGKVEVEALIQDLQALVEKM